MADLDRIAYVNQLELDFDNTSANDLAVNDATMDGLAADEFAQDGGAIGDASRAKASAYVVGSEVVSFPSNISPQHRQDVINSCLMAQMAANMRYPRDEDAQKHFNHYFQVLGQLGWDTTGMTLSEVHDAASHGTVNVLVLKTLAQILQPAAFSLEQTTINALNKPGKAISFLNQHARGRDQKSSTFNVGVCRYSEANNGNVIFDVGYYSHKANHTIDNILFSTLSDHRVGFSQGSHKIELDARVYKELRETVAKRVAPYAPKYIQSIFV
ncbi:hypothetical protein DL96DRAFT_1827511 [Flagelloscypha sp. PMI_526]|nr:hypothetical protein DL96DRAFT_1827511 [Flagelloscypha sp. PMI_526]